jgi:hypothetical protein
MAAGRPLQRFLPRHRLQMTTTMTTTEATPPFPFRGVPIMPSTPVNGRYTSKESDTYDRRLMAQHSQRPHPWRSWPAGDIPAIPGPQSLPGWLISSANSTEVIEMVRSVNERNPKQNRQRTTAPRVVPHLLACMYDPSLTVERVYEASVSLELPSKQKVKTVGRSESIFAPASYLPIHLPTFLPSVLHIPFSPAWCNLPSAPPSASLRSWS